MITSKKIKPQLPNEKASNFLKYIFQALDNAGLKYCVERNYDQYPKVIGGDVDLVIVATEMKSAMNIIIRIANKHAWNPFVLYSNSQAVHLGFYSDIYPERFVLVIELFAGGVWRGQQFLAAKRILEMRSRHGCTWKPHPAHEAVITLIHHLLYNRCVFEKYKQQIKICVDNSPEIFETDLCKPFGKKGAKSILECVQGNDWNKLEKQATQMRCSFLLRSLFLRPFQFFQKVVGILADIKCKPEGVAISLEAMSPNETEQFADAIIELAVQWHIFIPPVREKIYLSGSNANVSKEVKTIIKSGGVAVILNETNICISDILLQYPIIHISTNDGIAHISIGEQSTSCLVTGDTLAHNIWNVILKYRSDNLTWN